LLPASADFFLGLIFNPEDGDDVFLRNVGLYPKYAYLDNHGLYRVYKLKFNQDI
jgi:hypothetical protein